METQTS